MELRSSVRFIMSFKAYDARLKADVTDLGQLLIVQSNSLHSRTFVVMILTFLVPVL